jgi:hypothetical protein
MPRIEHSRASSELPFLQLFFAGLCQRSLRVVFRNVSNAREGLRK